MKPHRNISIVWDFDGTLTPEDSTSKIVEYFLGKGNKNDFWKWIREINGSLSTKNWERMLSSDAPTWMYALSRIAFSKKVPLSEQFFSKKKLTNLVHLYPGVVATLKKIKDFEKSKRFQDCKIKVYHFIVTAGLQEYVKELVPKEIFSNIWGGRYSMYPKDDKDSIKSIPVFCMDETMKTRALYEISKGVFNSTTPAVNKKVEKGSLWSPFNNFIYIGDGPTDIPALSLVKVYGGYGIVVFNPKKDKKAVKNRLKDMSADSRCDLITEAKFSGTSNLFCSIKNRCYQILQKYEAEDFSGRKEGRQEGIQQVIANMLKKKLDISLISEVTGMSAKEIKKLKNGA